MAQAEVNQQMIATHLSVSVATVSKALRNQPDVSSAMREKVAKAALDLGYRRAKPRAANRSNPRTDRSVMVAALIRQPLDHGTRRMPEYMDGLCEAATQFNASIIVQKYGYKSPVERLLLDPEMQPPAIREGKVQGLLLGGEWPTSVVGELAKRHHCVCFPNDVGEAGVDVIGLDNLGTSMKIVRDLIAQGHERIGFLGRSTQFAWTSERFAGYVNALSRLGREYNPEWVLDVDEEPMLHEGHEEYWRCLVDRIDGFRKAGVCAWMCSSDWPGYQLYRGMLNRGVRVPEDISIVGFDDSEPVNLGCPPLTSVRMPRDVMGHAAMRRLLFRIDNPDSPIRQTLFSGIVMDHQTTGPVQNASEVSQIVPTC